MVELWHKGLRPPPPGTKMDRWSSCNQTFGISTIFCQLYRITQHLPMQRSSPRAGCNRKSICGSRNGSFGTILGLNQRSQGRSSFGCNLRMRQSVFEPMTKNARVDKLCFFCPNLARTPSGSLTHMEFGKLRCLMRSVVPGLWLRYSPEHNRCIHSHSLGPDNR